MSFVNITVKFAAFLSLICMATFTVAVPAFAQDVQAKTPEPSSIEVDDGMGLTEKLGTYRVDVDILDVPIADVISHVQDQLPAPINIILGKGIRDINVPEMSLKNVSLEAFFNALQIATERMVVFEVSDSDEFGVLEIDESYASEFTVNVLNVSNILRDLPHPSLLSAIEIGLQMKGSSQSKVEMKLHEETKLLFVKGHESDIELIIQIVNQLGGQPGYRNSRVGGGAGAGGGGGETREGNGGDREPRGGGTFGGGPGPASDGGGQDNF